MTSSLHASLSLRFLRFPSAFRFRHPHLQNRTGLTLSLLFSQWPASLDQALDLLVSASCICYHTSTADLSTSSSLRGLTNLRCGSLLLQGGFTLRCLQRLSRPHFASLLCPWQNNSFTRECVHPGPLVLGTAPVMTPTPTMDRDRTVSRRSEPSSRAALIGEQPNPWDLLQPQDATSRHRGAKPPRRCGLLGEISLLSPR